MIFVFDENFSKRLAAGLDLLEKSNPAATNPVDVFAAEILMGRKGASDPELLVKIAGNGLLITQDKDFKQIKLIGKAIEDTGSKVLFFKYSKKTVLFWEKLVAIIDRWEEIKEKVSHPGPPHVFEFDINKGIKECYL